MTKEYDIRGWFQRCKHFLNLDPQNQEQLVNLLRDAHMRSLINKETLAMLEGALIFAHMQVRDIMLPKKQMVCIHQDSNFHEIIACVTQSGHSRFPVTGDSNHEIIGILHAKDLLRFQDGTKQNFDLHDLIRETTFIPESKRLDVLLADFQSNRNHMAMVVDEYGEVSGFVTLEDLIEQIIGEIEDEFDVDEEAYIKVHADAHYIVKAHTPVEEFNYQLQVTLNNSSYDTIGGVVMAAFGHMPKRGEVIVIEPFEFKVLNADARHIKLLECLDRRQPSIATEENYK